MATNERKWLWLEKSLGKAERQRRGASLLDEDDVGEGGDSKSDTNEDLKVLRCVLDESQWSGDEAGSRSGCCVARAVDEDGAAWKRLASLPLRRLSPKHPRATGDGGQGLSPLVPSSPPLSG